MYHHRRHGPERAPAASRVAREPGDRRDRPAAHRGSPRQPRRNRSARSRRAMGHRRRLRGRSAALRKDPGVARVRCRGPFASEQRFAALLECCRYDPGQALPFERFLADGALDWLPARHESHRVAAWASVQLRQDIEKVVADGVTFYRPEWQGIARREARVIRDEGERVVCSLWALGGPLADRLILDRSGWIIQS